MEEAIEEAQTALGLAPDFPFAHYALGSVLLQKDKPKEAEDAAREAVRLDPEDADLYALLGDTLRSQRRWSDALDAAELGLTLEPEHVECTNLRGFLLVQLGRREEAGETIDAALARDPDNAITHANKGWALLHHNDHKKALVHFREALRLDPELEWARAGILEALKARNIIYRVMLRYFLWMSRLSGKMQWAVIIGLVLLIQIDFLSPLIPLYLTFALLSWAASPLFNLMLRVDKFGKYVLSDDEIKGANWIGVCIGLAGALVVGGLVMSLQPLLLGGAAAAAMMIPVAGTFNVEPGRKRMMLALYAVSLAGIALAALFIALTSPEDALSSTLSTFFILGWVAFSWIANFVASSS